MIQIFIQFCFVSTIACNIYSLICLSYIQYFSLNMLFHSKILFSVTTFIFTQEPYFHLKNLFYFIIFPDDFTFGPNLLKYKEHTSSVPHPLSTFIQYGFGDKSM